MYQHSQFIQQHWSHYIMSSHVYSKSSTQIQAPPGIQFQHEGNNLSTNGVPLILVFPATPKLSLLRHWSARPLEAKAHTLPLLFWCHNLSTWIHALASLCFLSQPSCGLSCPLSLSSSPLMSQLSPGMSDPSNMPASTRPELEWAQPGPSPAPGLISSSRGLKKNPVKPNSANQHPLNYNLGTLLPTLFPILHKTNSKF